MQCGPSFTTNKRDPSISLAVRSPEAAIGKIRSASPWMTSVGTSIRVRSLRKSSYHVGTQAETGRGRGGSCDVPAGLDGLIANALAQQEVRVVEILEEIGEERVTVCGDGLLDSLEDTAVHAFRVVRRLQQERRNPRDDYRLAYALRSVFPQVARHFAATHRETNQCEIAQVELPHKFVQVLGEGVVVVADSRLAGLAEPSAVIRDDTVSRLQKRCDLLLPGSATQWISMNKDNRVTRAMVLLIDIDVAGVFRTDRSEWHRDSPRLSADWGLMFVG